MQILVVEQDAALGQFLARSLRTNGHEVEWVVDGEAALDQASSRNLDLLVLDMALDGLGGAEVLTQMHQQHASCSVIALIAEETVDSRVSCLDKGADDCLAKPFSLQELLARCRAQLRRRVNLNNDVLEHAGLRLDRRRRSVERHGVSIELTTKEFTLLEHLLEHRGRCSSRTELLRQVFQLPADAATNVVEVYINYLRRKLAPESLGVLPPVIETVRGSGYRIAGVDAKVRGPGSRTHLLHAASL